ncbi:polarity establishment/cellular polarization [Thecaphora frezii]
MGNFRSTKRCKLQAPAALALAAVLFAPATLADVTVRNPIAAQLPRVARPGQSYAWSFGDGTFSSDNVGHPISYEAQGLPRWATFDSLSRTLSGSPTDADTGSVSLTIVASEEGGKSARDTFTLLTRSGNGVSLCKPLPQQLPHASSLGAGNILPAGEQHIPLGWSFSIGFDGDTFTSPGRPIHTKALLADGSPLPGWLHFDQTMTLWGVAPTSPGSEGSSFEIVVLASTVDGFSEASSSVVLVVSSGALTLSKPIAQINATAGFAFSHTLEAFQVLLDGRAPPSSAKFDIALDTAKFPWISYDAASRKVSGTPPADAAADETVATLQVPLRISDSQQNALQINLTINVQPTVFTASALPDVAVQAGRHFEVELAQYVQSRTVDLTTVNVTFDPASAARWIHADAKSLKLTGEAPAGAKEQKVKVTLSATNPNVGPHGASRADFVLTASEHPQAVPQKPNGFKHKASDGKVLSAQAKVALAASLGSVGGIFLLVLLMICCRRCCAAEEHDIHGRRMDFAASLDDDQTLTGGKSPMVVFGAAMDSPLMQKWRKAKNKVHASPYLTAGHSPYSEKHVKISAPLSTKSSNASLSDSNSQVSITIQSEVRQARVRPAEVRSEQPTKSKLLGFLKSKSGRSLAREATINNASRSVHIGSIGLGLEGMAGSDDPYGYSQRSIGRSRSHARSSWESDLWLQDDSRATSRTSQHAGAVASGSVSVSILSGDSRSESPNEVPVRRGALVPMRHRNAHINDSPAFNLHHSFDTRSAEPDGSFEASRSQHRFAELTTSITMEEDLEGGVDAVVTRARKVQVQPTGTICTPQQVTIQPGQRNAPHRVVQLEDSNAAFEDAEDEPAYVEDMVRRRQERESVVPDKRTSYMPGLVGADISAIRFANDAQERSSVRPEETLRAVRPSSVPMLPTPLLPVDEGTDTILETPFHAASGATRARLRSTSSNAAARCPPKEQHVQTMPGELIRIKALSGSQAPPMVGGAPDSPGKRSGQRYNYVPVLQDEKYMEYWNTRPEFIEWLTWDSRMQELSGTVPPKFGPTPLSLRIAILARPVASQQQAPPSPHVGSTTKRHSRASSFESTTTVMENEVVAVVVVHIQKAVFERTGAKSIELQRGHAF